VDEVVNNGAQWRWKHVAVFWLLLGLFLENTGQARGALARVDKISRR
jgi:hypothetical protein